MCLHAGKRCNARSSPTRISSYSINRSATVPQFSWMNGWGACVGREERRSGGWRAEGVEEGRGKGEEATKSLTQIERRILSMEYSLYKPSAAGWPHSMHKLKPSPPWTVTAAAGGGAAGGAAAEETGARAARRAVLVGGGPTPDRGIRSNALQALLCL